MQMVNFARRPLIGERRRRDKRAYWPRRWSGKRLMRSGEREARIATAA